MVNIGKSRISGFEKGNETPPNPTYLSGGPSELGQREETPPHPTYQKVSSQHCPAPKGELTALPAKPPSLTDFSGFLKIKQMENVERCI